MWSNSIGHSCVPMEIQKAKEAIAVAHLGRLLVVSIAMHCKNKKFSLGQLTFECMLLNIEARN